MSVGRFYSAKKFLYNLLWNLKIKLWWFVSERKGGALTNTAFSIGIVTYVDRFSNFFKPLLIELVTLFPDTEFVITINGYHDQVIQSDYLQEIAAFLAEFPNVKLVDFHRPQSLSRLWNLLVIHSSFEKVLILNDDIRISPGFRKNLEDSSFLEQEVALINRSWSHFLISKSAVGKFGWFDQRFPGVGNEDEDYECRLVIAGVQIPSFHVKSLKNISFITINFSYGKEMEVVNTKYVKANKIYFDRKWELSHSPADGFVYVKILDAWVKPKTGMETPDFYPETKLYK